jgi:DNA-directed RNA polymerase specialized sigma24 family protein
MKLASHRLALLNLSRERVEPLDPRRSEINNFIKFDRVKFPASKLLGQNEVLGGNFAGQRENGTARHFGFRNDEMAVVDANLVFLGSGRGLSGFRKLFKIRFFNDLIEKAFRIYRLVICTHVFMLSFVVSGMLSPSTVKTIGRFTGHCTRVKRPNVLSVMGALEDDQILAEPNPIPDLVTVSHPELHGESDDGLLTLMAFKDTDEELSCRACEELHRRHSQFLLAWCIQQRKETFGESAEAFVNATFIKAYREADSFVCRDRANAKQQVVAWLFRILKNLFLDSLDSEKRRPVVRSPDGSSEWLEEIEQNQEAIASVPTARKAKALRYLETLSPKDREILTITAEFWDSEKGEPEIDEDVRAGICKEYGLTESSLRVKRKRLKDRGKQFLEERENS